MIIRSRWTLLAALLALAFGAPALAAQSPETAWVEGRWRWSQDEAGCDSAYDIRMTRGDKYVVASYVSGGEPDTAEYRVLDFVPGVIRGRIEGEKRLDSGGNPVIWDFVQLSEDAFCWHLVGGATDNCTVPLYRCTVVVPGREARARAAAGPPDRRRGSTR